MSPSRIAIAWTSVLFGVDRRDLAVVEDRDPAHRATFSVVFEPGPPRPGHRAGQDRRGAHRRHGRRRRPCRPATGAVRAAPLQRTRTPPASEPSPRVACCNRLQRTSCGYPTPARIAVVSSARSGVPRARTTRPTRPRGPRAAASASANSQALEPPGLRAGAPAGDGRVPALRRSAQAGCVDGRPAAARRRAPSASMLARRRPARRSASVASAEHRRRDPPPARRARRGCCCSRADEWPRRQIAEAARHHDQRPPACRRTRARRRGTPRS